MAGIKEYKKKIKGTKSTLKITSAMKLVSAAKLNRAQHAILSSRPYAKELENTIKTVSALAKDYQHPFLQEKSGEEQASKYAALLVISSDKGLCGPYNSQLSREVKSFIKNCGLELKVFFVGKKVKELLKGQVNVGKHYNFEKSEPTFNDMKSVASELSSLFSSGEVGKVFVAYNVFQSAIQFTPTVSQVLPMSMDLKQKEELLTKFPFDFKYEPGPQEILNDLIPEAYTTSVYTCLLDALAAEHGSRMGAMDSASKNCKDAIRTLTLKMNKLRQAGITTQLIEVVSGAESLNG